MNTPLNSFATERIYVRPLQKSDAQSMLEYHSDPQVTRYIPWPTRNLEQVREALDKYITYITLEKEGDYLMLGFFRKEDNQLLGQINAMYRSEEHQLAEFGYVINPRFAGQGLATEAVKEMISQIFKTGKFHRVIARMDARNNSSARLCERLGLRLEAHHLQDDWFKGEWTDTYIYAILKNEWK